MVINSNINNINNTQNLNTTVEKTNPTTNKEVPSAFIELSGSIQKYLDKGIAGENSIAQSVDYAKESVEFSKENLSVYSGSLSLSQANTNSDKVASLTA